MRNARYVRGTAQVEFLMAFPLLIGIFCVVFPLVSASMTRMRNTEITRNQAFAARHQPWLPGEFELKEIANGMDSISAVLGPSPLVEPKRSLAHGEHESEVDPIADFYKNLVSTKPKDEAATLAGSWSAPEITFDEHARLTLPKQATHFGFSRRLDEFVSLNTFQAAAMAEFNRMVQQLGLGHLLGGSSQAATALNQALGESRTKIAEVAQELAQAEQQQERLENEENRLQDLLVAQPDNEQIEEELEQIRERQDALEENIQELEEASRLITIAIREIQTALQLVSGGV